MGGVKGRLLCMAAATAVCASVCVEGSRVGSWLLAGSSVRLPVWWWGGCCYSQCGDGRLKP